MIWTPSNVKAPRRSIKVAVAVAAMLAPLAGLQTSVGAEVGPSSPSQFIAGNGGYACPTSGQAATSQSLKNPYDAVPDSSGNVYIADNDCHKVFKITADGVIHDFAGTGTAGGTGDGGQAASATFTSPDGLLLSKDESILYIADGGTHRVRQVNLSTGVVTAFAGTGTSGKSGDGGAAASANMTQPFGMALSSGGDIYIADYNGHTIWKVDAGTATIHVYLSLNDGPRQVGFDGNGILYYAIANDHKVYSYSGSGSPSVLYDTGGGSPGSLPEAVTVDTSGNLFVGLRGLGPTGQILKLKTDGSSSVGSSVMSSSSSGCGSGSTAADLQVNYPWLMHAIGSSLFVAIGGCGSVARFGPQYIAGPAGPTCAASAFHYSGGYLYSVDPSTGVYTSWPNIKVPGLNAMGYDTASGKLVAIRLVSGQPHVISVATDGTTADLGVPTGATLPSSASSYVAGDTDDNGNLWVRISGRSLLQINLSTLAATTLALHNQRGRPTQARGADIVYLGGSFYSLDNGTLYSVDSTSGLVTKQSVSGITGSGQYGAGFVGQSGALDFVNNASGTISELTGFSSSSASVAQTFQGWAWSKQSDGASCRS